MQFLTDFIEKVLDFGESVMDLGNSFKPHIPEKNISEEEKSVSVQDKSSWQEDWDGFVALSPPLDDKPKTCMGALLITIDILDYLDPQFLPSLKHFLYDEEEVHISIPEEETNISEQDKIWQRKVRGITGLYIFSSVLVTSCLFMFMLLIPVVEIGRLWYPDFMRS